MSGNILTRERYPDIYLTCGLLNVNE